MRIGYGKICRSIPLTHAEASNVGGDSEVVTLLEEFVKRGHEVHIISRTQSKAERPIPGVFNHFAPRGIFGDPPMPKWSDPGSRTKGPAFDAYTDYYTRQSSLLPEFDAIFMWLGDHGTSNHPMPGIVKATLGKYTTTRQQDAIYGWPPMAILNALGDARGVRPHWLCPDPRNMIKFRDLWHADQRPILAQFNTSKESSFYHERDDKIRKANLRYSYSGIELLALQRNKAVSCGPSVGHSALFGLLVNEGYNNLPDGKGRKDLVRRWCPPDTPIVGTWSESSVELLAGHGYTVSPPVALNDVALQLSQWKATMTFPATNSGWATAKPWECFAAGTVCFRHPDYDTQGHIYRDDMNVYTVQGIGLKQFLSPLTQNAFKERLEMLKNDEVYYTAAAAQFLYLKDSWQRLDGGFIAIDDALNGRAGW
jgi:hypothetical protein